MHSSRMSRTAKTASVTRNGAVLKMSYLPQSYKRGDASADCCHEYVVGILSTHRLRFSTRSEVGGNEGDLAAGSVVTTLLWQRLQTSSHQRGALMYDPTVMPHRTYGEAARARACCSGVTCVQILAEQAPRTSPSAPTSSCMSTDCAGQNRTHW